MGRLSSKKLKGEVKGLLCPVTLGLLPHTKAFASQFLSPLEEGRTGHLRVQTGNAAQGPRGRQEGWV